MIQKEVGKEPQAPSKGILFCRKLMASQRQMQEEAQKDWYDPRIQAIIQKQKERLRDEAK